MTRSMEQVKREEKNIRVNLWKKRRNLDEEQLLGRLSLGLLVLFVVFCFVSAVAYAEEYSPRVGYMTSCYSILDENGSQVERFSSFEPIVVVGEKNDYYEVIKKNNWESGNLDAKWDVPYQMVVIGVRKKITIENQTLVYGIPETIAVGNFKENNDFYLLGQFDGQYAISVGAGVVFVPIEACSAPFELEEDKILRDEVLKENKAIEEEDFQEDINLARVNCEYTVPVYNDPVKLAQVGVLQSGDYIEICEESGKYTKFIFRMDGLELYFYIETIYLETV